MRPSLVLSSLAVPAVLAFLAPDAKACQPPPEDLLGLMSSYPEDGATGIAVDSGIVLFGGLVVDAGYDFHQSLGSEIENIELVDSQGRAVPGAMVPWGLEDGMDVAWAPETPLDADTTYTLNATLSRDDPLGQFTEEELATAATISATFTTGSATTPALTAGAPSLALSELEVDIRDCPEVGDCGLSCVVVGTQTYPQLEVTIPEVEGGNDIGGYNAYVAVSAESPLVFTGIAAPESTPATPLLELQEGTLLADGPNTIAIPLYETDIEPIVPCVSAIVWDPSGKTVTLDPVCATTAVTFPTTGGSGGEGGASAGADQGGSAGTIVVTAGGGSELGTGGTKPEVGGAGAGGDVKAAGGSADDASGGAVNGGGGSAGALLVLGGTSGDAGNAGTTQGVSGGQAGGGDSTGVGGVSEGGETAEGGGFDDAKDTGGEATQTGLAGASDQDQSVDSASDDGKDSGCSCRAAPSRDSTPAPLAALAALLLAGVRRRQRNA